jgi:hypothetical protein
VQKEAAEPSLGWDGEDGRGIHSKKKKRKKKETNVPSRRWLGDGERSFRVSERTFWTGEV